MESVAENFKSLTISHDHAPLEIREKVMLGEEQIRMLLKVFKDDLGATDALILSTCNRTEIYYSHTEDLTEQIQKFLSVVLLDTNLPKDHFLKRMDHHENISRIFEVAIGLQSQVIGDMQISNQVKKAYQWSADEQMAGPILHRLMHTIFYTNKRVVQETSFRDGSASVSYASKELAEDIATQLSNPVILVVGTGEIGRDLCDNLSGSAHRVVVTNRTSETAHRMSDLYGFEYLPFESLRQFAIREADIIISSVSMLQPLFTKDFFDTKTLHKHHYLIDLSVPRSVDEELRTEHGFVIYNIDELESKTSEALETRLKSLDKVKTIVAEEIDNFYDWSRDMIVSPTIKRLKNALESIRQDELERYLKRASENEQQLLDKATRSMMQKVLKLPVLELKAACRRGEADTLIDVLNDLFNLEKQEEKKAGD